MTIKIEPRQIGKNLKLKEVPMTYFLDKTRNTNVRNYCKTYKIPIIQKKVKIKRFDFKIKEVNSGCISLYKLDLIIEELEDKFNKTKNWNTKEGITYVKKRRKDLLSYLEENSTGEDDE